MGFAGKGDGTRAGIDRPAEIGFKNLMSSVVEVGLGARSYPIHLLDEGSEGIRAEVARLREARRGCALLVDAGLAEAQGEFVERAFGDMPVLKLPGGEKTKSLEQLGRVWDFLAESGIDRQGRLFVAGGGVIGDLGGFAAASYLRGIDFYQVPTTLLSMVDSSVGGKTGINIAAGKNLVGAFHQPRAVFIGTGLLATLPESEFHSGMGEVIKYGLLGDAKLFEQLRGGGPLSATSKELPEVIRRCCEIKAEIVRADEKEEAGSGGRALLNLGHTFAHAVEQAAGYGEYLHGEAVGLGLVMASALSRELGYLSETDVETIRETVRAYGLPVVLRSPVPTDALLAAMRRDKKVKEGRLRFVVLRRLGEAMTVDDVDETIVTALWRHYGGNNGESGKDFPG